MRNRRQKKVVALKVKPLLFPGQIYPRALLVLSIQSFLSYLAPSIKPLSPEPTNRLPSQGLKVVWCQGI